MAAPAMRRAKSVASRGLRLDVRRCFLWVRVMVGRVGVAKFGWYDGIGGETGWFGLILRSCRGCMCMTR